MSFVLLLDISQNVEAVLDGADVETGTDDFLYEGWDIFLRISRTGLSFVIAPAFLSETPVGIARQLSVTKEHIRALPRRQIHFSSSNTS